MSNELALISGRSDHRQPTILVDHVESERMLFILDAARERGWRLVDMAVTKGVLPRGCSPIGAIIGLPVDHPAISWLKKLDCPIVRIGKLPHPLDHQVPAVIVDFYAASRLAAEHFSERNFKHMAYIGHKPWLGMRMIYDNFSSHAKKQGCTCDLFRLNEKSREERSIRFERLSVEIEKWLKKLPKPIGLFTYTDSMGAWVETICDSARLTVPEDVAILGLGNGSITCETSPVELSSIDMGHKALAREAVRLLHCLVTGKAVPSEAVVIQPVGVIERQSTHVLAVPDPTVAKAIRYIWDHLDLQVSVDNIASHAGISRRSLERAFRKTLGRSVNGELLRKRLERCTELLHDTGMTVEEIAAATGFLSRSYLHRAFRKKYNLSPGEYRKRGRGEKPV